MGCVAANSINKVVLRKELVQREGSGDDNIHDDVFHYPGCIMKQKPNIIKVMSQPSHLNGNKMSFEYLLQVEEFLLRRIPSKPFDRKPYLHLIWNVVLVAKVFAAWIVWFM